MLTVDLTSLSPGIHHVSFAPTAEEAGLDPNTFSDIRVEAELQYHRDRLLVKLRAAATAELTCDRTLKPFEQPVVGNYNLLYGPPSMVGQEGEEFEEVRPLNASDTEIDLTDITRDTLLLALPQRQIAPDAPDEPVEQSFGPSAEEKDNSSSPADPRWSKLEELRENDSS